MRACLQIISAVLAFGAVELSNKTIELHGIVGEYIVLNEEVPTHLDGFAIQRGAFLSKLIYKYYIGSSEQEHKIFDELSRRFSIVDREVLIEPAATLVANDGNTENLNLIGMPLVWAEFGFEPHVGRRAVIAISDNGAPFNNDFHDWVNVGEIPDNGIDDDENGYIDDTHGWNAYSRTGDLSYAGGHGSTVSRIAAAISNNGTGGASPASSASLMRVLHSTGGSAGYYDALDTIAYAARNKADVINCSWVTTASTMMSWVIAIAEQNNSIIVAAAGNDGKDLATLGDILQELMLQIL